MLSNENSFNKRLFSELIKQIKGKRTLSKLAEDTNTSIAHISRMINEKLESPPSPETIKKLVPVEANGVTYKDLMMAAGHLSQINLFEGLDIKIDSELNLKSSTDDLYDDATTNSQILEEKRKFKYLCMSTILFTLSRNNMACSIPANYDKTTPNRYTNEFSLELADSYITTWTFGLKYFNSFKNSKCNLYGVSLRYVIDTWGQLACLSLAVNSKYTIVTDSEDLYNMFFKYPPKNLNINISIMLVNTDEVRVLKEEYVSYYKDADITELKKVITC